MNSRARVFRTVSQMELAPKPRVEKKPPQTILSGRLGNNWERNGSTMITMVMVTKMVTVSTAVMMTSVVMGLVVTTNPGECCDPLTKDPILASKQ